MDNIYYIHYVHHNHFLLLISESTASPVIQKGQSDILDVGTPFYQDGQLQVRVYWKKRGKRKVMDCVFHQSRPTEGKTLHGFLKGHYLKA